VIDGRLHAGMGYHVARELQRQFAKVREAAERRGWTDPSQHMFAYTLSRVDYPLDQLARYFERGSLRSDVANQEMAEILVSFVRDRLAELEQIAKGVDDAG